MECSNKNKSSYQTLKQDFETLKEEHRKKERKLQLYYNALMKIAALRGADVVEAPLKAMDALIEAQEINETK